MPERPDLYAAMHFISQVRKAQLLLNFLQHITTCCFRMAFCEIPGALQVVNGRDRWPFIETIVHCTILAMG
jgi:hypothetical protein